MITPFLWYNTDIAEVIAHYRSLFPDLTVSSEMPGPDGKTFSATFTIEGQTFSAFNGGPMFQFTEATSWMVTRETQEEIDYLWNALSEGGKKQSCGWIKDRFGVSWQIVPKYLKDVLSSGDGAKIGRVMAALQDMEKLEIEGLKKAAEGAV